MMKMPKWETPAPKAGRHWEGLNFVVTGKIEGMTRPQAEQSIRERGGTTSSSVTKHTHILVTGDKPGSKLAKAQQNGVRIMDEFEFKKVLTELE